MVCHSLYIYSPHAYALRKLFWILELPLPKRTRLINCQYGIKIFAWRFHVQPLVWMQSFIILYLFCHFFHHWDCIRQIIYLHVIPLERVYKRFCHAVTFRMRTGVIHAMNPSELANVRVASALQQLCQWQWLHWRQWPDINNPATKHLLHESLHLLS